MGDMTFIDKIFNIIINIPLAYLNLSIVFYVLNSEIKKNRVLLIGVIVSILVSVFGSLFRVLGDADTMTFLSTQLVYITTIIVYFLVITFVRKQVSIRNFCAVLLVLFFESSIFDISTIFIYTIFKLDSLNYHIVYLCITYIFMPLIYFFMISIIKKLSFNIHFTHYFKEKTSAIVFTIIMTLITIFCNNAYFIFSDITQEGKYSFLVPSIFLLMVLSCFFYVAFYQKSKAEVKAKEILLLEQHNYLHSLESVQKEIRSFQHDYKNIITALYLYAEEGDTVKIKEYLNGTVLEFDSDLSNKIKQTTNLANILNIEVKSLILAKLIIMEKKGIKFHVEVLNKIDIIKMDTHDIIRCLGILLDNAIEATNQKETIKLVFSNEESDLMIMIKNPTNTTPALNKIWDEGYSSKGINRGLGLYNYKKIVSGYHNVFKRTISENNEFTQILRIYS